MIDYEDAIQGPTDEDVKLIAKLAGLQLELEKKVEHAEKVLKDLKTELRKVQERDLPEAMKAAGMESFTLITGEKISVKETLYASIAKKNKSAAIQWLMDNGHGEIVKENIMVAFEKGEHDKVDVLVDMLEANGYSNFNVDENINTATVKSLIKELMSEGVDVPLDLFGAHFARTAEVKR